MRAAVGRLSTGAAGWERLDPTSARTIRILGGCGRRSRRVQRSGERWGLIGLVCMLLSVALRRGHWDWGASGVGGGNAVRRALELAAGSVGDSMAWAAVKRAIWDS